MPSSKSHLKPIALAVMCLGCLLLMLAFFLPTIINRLVLEPEADSRKGQWRLEYFSGKQIDGKAYDQGVAPGGKRLKLGKPESSLLAFTLWNAPKSGTYGFELTCDDYGSLYLDGNLVITQEPTQTGHVTKTATAMISAGPHLLKAVLRNGAETGWLQLRIREPGSRDWRILPAAQMGYIGLGSIPQVARLMEFGALLSFAGVLFFVGSLLTMAFPGLMGPTAQTIAKKLSGVLRLDNVTNIKALSFWGLQGPWLLLAAVAVFLELAFLLSKRSFLSMFGGWEIFIVALNATVILSLIPLTILGVAYAMWMVAGKSTQVASWIQRISLLAWGLCFVAVLAAHFNGFMYNTFSLTLVDLREAGNWYLGMLLALLLLLGLQISARWGVPLLASSSGHSRVFAWSISGLLAFTLVTGVVNYIGLMQEWAPPAVRAGKVPTKPNIILFAADGVPQDHLSLYGYQRPTSPFLEELAQSSLLFKLAFTNSHSSTGSTASILTGTLPINNKVLYGPDILTGKKAHRHLPGILARLGYYCMDLNDGYWTSSAVINMQGGFHEENGRTRLLAGSEVDRLLDAMYSADLYFLGSLFERVNEPVLYMLGLSKKMETMLTRWQGMETPDRMGDDERVQRLIQVIKTEQRPLFAHLHLVKTHGPWYGATIRRFAKPGKKPVKNDPDLFDDAVLSTDHLIRQLVTALKKSGKWQNTLLIFHTDHGKGYVGHNPLPLLIHLPGQEKGVVVPEPVQYLDLAPSILHVIGYRKPVWMEGRSMFPLDGLAGAGKRPIYAFAGILHERQRFIGPPFYGLSQAQLIIQGVYYYLDLPSDKHTSGRVKGWPGAPRDPGPRAASRVGHALRQYLDSKGIETAALKGWLAP
jgi:sulfatase-like protein